MSDVLKILLIVIIGTPLVLLSFVTVLIIEDLMKRLYQTIKGKVNNIWKQ
ncbi:MAG: hypothetical protein GY928_08125 [Colwellia sp.]|nr:hypothetical protein [Colwellia sp.]